MSYLVNEVFYSVQGEGAHTGQPAIFLRFSRCNLWTGREKDRATAICRFCDTDFTAGTRYEIEELISVVTDLLPDTAWRGRTPMIVLTGGEPTLQADEALIDALLRVPFYVAIETNGTKEIKLPLDWVCVSPKAGAELRQTSGDELKLVYPQDGIDPADYEGLDFDRFSLSPMDGPDLAENTRLAFDYVLAHPRWDLNIQTHKQIGVR